MPASVSAANSMSPARRRFLAYSVRYTAAPTPRGRTMARESKMTYSVFSRAGRMPFVPRSTLSRPVRKAQESPGSPLNRIYPTRKTSSPQQMPAPSHSRSRAPMP